MEKKIRWGGYQDLPETNNDKAVAEFGFSQLGILPENLWVLTDPKKEDVTLAILDICRITVELKKQNRGSALLAYFACHGQCKDGNQEILINDKKPINIETSLRSIAWNAFTIGIFDCCREKADYGPTRGRE